MFKLVSKIQDGLGELKNLLEKHIHTQGDAAVDQNSDAAINVSQDKSSQCLRPSIICGICYSDAICGQICAVLLFVTCHETCVAVLLKRLMVNSVCKVRNGKIFAF